MEATNRESLSWIMALTGQCMPSMAMAECVLMWVRRGPISISIVLLTNAAHCDSGKRTTGPNNSVLQQQHNTSPTLSHTTSGVGCSGTQGTG